MLNNYGSFCFITSNSWLNVGYGKDLQKFLLTRSKIKFIIDNQFRRSFASADINTILVLLSAPIDSPQPINDSLDHIARFVMFNIPFEQALDPILWEEICESNLPRTRNEFKLYPINQSSLFEVGFDLEKNTYRGDKWGSKYLRAPNIYWTINQKGDGKFIRLGDICQIRRGFTTGANQFFLLEETDIDKWGIEDRFLNPIIHSPKDCSQIVVREEDFRYNLFLCSEDIDDLLGTAALEYIRWGEEQGFNSRSTLQNRKRWWDLGKRNPANINANYLIDETMRFFVKHGGFFVSDNFQEIHVDDNLLWQLALVLNSSITQLHANVIGRTSFGGGLIKIQTYELADFMVLDPKYLDKNICYEFINSADDLSLNSANRISLDEYIFDILDLNKNQREDVNEGLRYLVKLRLQKANSLKARKASKELIEMGW